MRPAYWAILSTALVAAFGSLQAWVFYQQWWSDSAQRGYLATVIPVILALAALSGTVTYIYSSTVR